MRFKIEGNASNILGRLGRIDDAIRASLEEKVEGLGSTLVSKIKSRAPVKTGAYRGSIEKKVAVGATGVLATVGANPTGGNSKGSRRSYYALWLEYGAKPHKIVAKNAPLLAFMGSAGMVYRRSVNHTGQAAQQVVHGPFKEMRKEIVGAINSAVAEAL